MGGQQDNINDSLINLNDQLRELNTNIKGINDRQPTSVNERDLSRLISRQTDLLTDFMRVQNINRQNLTDPRINNTMRFDFRDNVRQTSVSISNFFSKTFGNSFVTRILDKVTTVIKTAVSGIINVARSLVNNVMSGLSGLFHMAVETFKELTIRPMLEASEKYIETTNQISKEVKWSKGQFQSFADSLVDTVHDLGNKVGANEVLATAQKVVQLGIKDQKAVNAYTKALTKLQLAIDVDSSDMSELLELTKRLGTVGAKAIEKMGKSIRALDDANLVKALGNKDLMKFASKMSEIFQGNSEPDSKEWIQQQEWALAAYNELSNYNKELGEGFSQFLQKIANARKTELGQLSVDYRMSAFEIRDLIDKGDIETILHMYLQGVEGFVKSDLWDITGEVGKGYQDGVSRMVFRHLQRQGISADKMFADIKNAKDVMHNAPESNLDDAVKAQNVGKLQEFLNSQSTLGIKFGEMLRDTGVNSKDINYAIDKLTQIVSMGLSAIYSVLETGIGAIKSVLDTLLPGWMQTALMIVGGYQLANKLFG